MKVFEFAIERNKPNITKLLLSFGADPNLAGPSDRMRNPPLIDAINKGNRRVTSHVKIGITGTF